MHTEIEISQKTTDELKSIYEKEHGVSFLGKREDLIDKILGRDRTAEGSLESIRCVWVEIEKISAEKKEKRDDLKEQIGILGEEIKVLLYDTYVSPEEKIDKIQGSWEKKGRLEIELREKSDEYNLRIKMLKKSLNYEILNCKQLSLDFSCETEK